MSPFSFEQLQEARGKLGLLELEGMNGHGARRAGSKAIGSQLRWPSVKRALSTCHVQFWQL